jgi:hypothetical protein
MERSIVALLYIGRLSSLVCGFFELYLCRMCTIIRLMTSVWPSVCGWKAVDLVILVSNIDRRLDKNVLRNLLSRSEMIDCGIPKCTYTRSKKSLAMASAMILFLQAIIMDIFKNLSTTTKTQSFPCLVEGRLHM